ncbi:MAG: hypothetical protein ACOC6P_03495 [Candidatus Aminicenantaceae bacterium]
MDNIINWIINLKLHEVILWGVIIALLIWEFIIQRRIRKPMGKEISKLKDDYMKLGFSAELAKKDIGDLYQKYKLTEEEIKSIKRETDSVFQKKKPSVQLKNNVDIQNYHLFILKVLKGTDTNRALAEFVLAYYLKKYTDKDVEQYREVLGDLLDNELIDFHEDQGKTYMEITEKGIEHLNSVEYKEEEE